MASIQNMVYFLVDDFEEDYKIEKINKSLMSLLLSPFIVH